MQLIDVEICLAEGAERQTDRDIPVCIVQTIAVPRVGETIWVKAHMLPGGGSAREEVACGVVAVEWKFVGALGERWRMTPYVFVTTGG